MRIDSNANLVRTAENSGRPQKANPRTASSSTRSAHASEPDKLTADQVRLHSLESRVNGMPEVRQEKVEPLAKAVRNGTYEPAPEKTAQALMASMSAGRKLR